MSYLEEDLDNISHSEFADKLKEKKVFVTGATGLVGSLLVRSLIRIGSNVYALVRNPDKARVIYGNETNRIHLVKGDITNSDWFDQVPDIDYVFHCAAITTSKTMISKPVETIDTAISGTRNLLDFSISHHVNRFVYISSMEIYGTLPVGEIATEDKLGYIDLFKVRSNYPESKRLCENLCVAYQSEYGLDVVIARLAQTFGPGVLPWDNRVFAQFAKSVIENKDIVLHTRGLSEGNYCYSRDLVKGLFTILVNGSSGEVYNVVNEATHTTIANMAEMVAHNIAKNRIKVVYDIAENNTFGYAADVHLRLSGKKLENLGWKPEVGLEDMYKRMIGDMEESINPNIDIRLRAKLLPATLALKNGVQNDKNSNPEIYLLEFLNESKWFQNLSNGEKYHAPITEDHGENDAISSSYEIDFKTVISSSMGRALRETSPQVVQYCPGVIGIGPSKHHGEIEWCSSITKDLRSYKFRDLEKRSYQYQEDAIVTKDIDDFLKVLRKDKNIFMFLPVEFSVDNLNPGESPIDIIGEALLYDTEFIYEYRDNHVLGRETYISTIYKDDLLIYKYDKDSLDFIEAIPLSQSKTFMYLAQI